MADAERCLMCGIIIPEGRQVCPACEVPEREDDMLKKMDKKIQLNDVTPGSICKVVADLFDVPCDYSPCDEELCDEDLKTEWCEEHCGKATAADCWLNYFQTRKEVKTDGE